MPDNPNTAGPGKPRPRLAKAHSQSVADEYVRLGWTLRHELQVPGDSQPYEYLLEWQRDAEPPIIDWERFARKPSSRWFQFRLRTLLIFVAILALFCPLGIRLVKKWEESRRSDANALNYRPGGTRDYGPPTDKLHAGPGSDAGLVGRIILDPPTK